MKRHTTHTHTRRHHPTLLPLGKTNDNQSPQVYFATGIIAEFAFIGEGQIDSVCRHHWLGDGEGGGEGEGDEGHGRILWRILSLWEKVEKIETIWGWTGSLLSVLMFCIILFLFTWVLFPFSFMWAFKMHLYQYHCAFSPKWQISLYIYALTKKTFR